MLFVGMILVALVASMTSTAVAAKTSNATDYRPLVGTWLVDVAETEGGVPAFQSLMTFHKGGTLTEVSDELGLGLQGPAQGMWQKRPDGYIATFQLWIFSPDTGEPDGRIQVRMTFDKTRRHRISGDTVIDYIDPSGEVIANIDSGPFTGVRQKLLTP